MRTRNKHYLESWGVSGEFENPGELENPEDLEDILDPGLILRLNDTGAR